MSAPLVVVVLFGPTADPTAEGVAAAARSALGDATLVTDTSAVASDADALAIGAQAHARAVARITWSDGSFVHARLHVHVAPSEAWADDELDFAASDPASEKGRAVGFTLASMVQRLDAAPVPPSPPPHEIPLTPPPPEVVPSAPQRFEAFALLTGTVGGAATSGGGALGARWISPSGGGARVAIGAAAGEVGDGHSVAVTMTGGPTYDLQVTSSFEAGLRLDVSASHLAVVRGDASRSRWLGGAAVLAEFGFALSERLALAAAIGPGGAFGDTKVRANGVEVAEIPKWRIGGELGLRIRL